MQIIENIKLDVTDSQYTKLNNNPSTITIYSSMGDNMSLKDVEKRDKANNKLTFSGHFYIRSNGEIFKGRPIEAIGEFAYNRTNEVNLNYDNIGICLEGDFNYNFFPDIQKFALYSLLDYLRELYGKNISMNFLREFDLNHNPGILFPFGDIIKYYYETYEVKEKLIGNLNYTSFGSRELYYDPTSPMKGTDVYHIQVLLDKLSLYEGNSDGIFDLNTKIAVANYQTSKSLIGTGIAGYSTISRMLEDIKKLNSDGSFSRILEKENGNSDMEGNDVIALQRRLIEKGYKCNVNGIYDTATSDAIYKFQTLNNIDADGKVGPITWDAIFSDRVNVSFRTLLLNSSNLMCGEDVKLLQTRLVELGYRLPITEKYDLVTEGQVRRYQILKNFSKADGIVTVEVWNKIFSEDQTPL